VRPGRQHADPRALVYIGLYRITPWRTKTMCLSSPAAPPCMVGKHELRQCAHRVPSACAGFQRRLLSSVGVPLGEGTTERRGA
jgi:hypothetical protein